MQMFLFFCFVVIRPITLTSRDETSKFCAGEDCRPDVAFQVEVLAVDGHRESREDEEDEDKQNDTLKRDCARHLTWTETGGGRHVNDNWH